MEADAIPVPHMASRLAGPVPGALERTREASILAEHRPPPVRARVIENAAFRQNGTRAGREAARTRPAGAREPLSSAATAASPAAPTPTEDAIPCVESSLPSPSAMSSRS